MLWYTRIIKEALFLRKMEHFPKIRTKTLVNRELGDLFLEVEAAKSELNTWLTVLRYSVRYSCYHGETAIQPSREVMTQGTKYKQRHQVSFPSFYFFLKFHPR